MIRNKKAKLMDYSLGLIPKIVFTIVVVIVSLVVIGQAMNFPDLSREIDADVISSLIMYNPAIMKIDENTERLYPGWIDNDKFMSDDVQTKFAETLKTYDDVYYAGMNISLLDRNKNIVRNFYYKEREYKNNLVLVESELRVGSGSYQKYNYFYPVFYGATKEPGILKIEIILPN